MNRPNKNDFLTSNQYTYQEELNKYYDALEKYADSFTPSIEKERVTDWEYFAKTFHRKYRTNIQMTESFFVERLVSAISLSLQDRRDKWISYDWNNLESRPKEYGRYEVYRKGALKQHYETWNGSGWASNNGDITHYRTITPPLVEEKK